MQFILIDLLFESAQCTAHCCTNIFSNVSALDRQQEGM